jgi:hypothetical protein
MHWQGDSMYGGPQQYKPFKERGGCLLIWLIFTIGSSLIYMIWTLSGGPQALIERANPSLAEQLPPWYWAYGVFSNFVIVVCAVGIWMWKKWGFYGYMLITIIGFLISLMMGNFPVFSGIIGVGITLAIAWYVVTPYWEDME